MMPRSALLYALLIGLLSPLPQASAQDTAAPVEALVPNQNTPPAPTGGAEPTAPDAPLVTAEPSQARAAVPVDAPVDTVPHDLTPWGMFMAADWVVKAVMVGLAFASLVTWTICLSKALEIAFAKRRARRGVRRLEDAQSLEAALNEGRRRWRGPVAALAFAADGERSLSGSLSSEGVKERAAIALARVEARAGRAMSRGTGILATIGSTAPFVGLFGTVWGIMNSFISISESNTTNLAVVAPGIAEALLATGIGLVAAIPAVIIYNAFSRSIAGYRAILADGSAAVMRHLSRDLDRSRSLGAAE